MDRTDISIAIGIINVIAAIAGMEVFLKRMSSKEQLSITLINRFKGSIGACQFTFLIIERSYK